MSTAGARVDASRLLVPCGVALSGRLIAFGGASLGNPHLNRLYLRQTNSIQLFFVLRNPSSIDFLTS
jgi:hypothetical protein